MRLGAAHSVRLLCEHLFVSTLRSEIARLDTEGVRPTEIAWRLNVAPTTVSYHLAELRAGPEPARMPEPPATPPDVVPTRERVRSLLSEGSSRAEIARRLGLTEPTVTYHARRLGEEIDQRCARRYDWDAVQRYHDAGHSGRECRRHFGISGQTWHAARMRGAITTRPPTIPVEQLLVVGRRTNRTHLKQRLLAAGLKDGSCEACGLTDWRELPISMTLHHVNGDRQDNRLLNLEILCPNCHSQTDTFSGRNGHRRPKLDDAA